jgi:hypothetical protein
MKLGQLIRVSGLALALAAGLAGCDDDEGGTTDGGPRDTAADVPRDTPVTPDTAVDTNRPDATDTAADTSRPDGGADGGDAGGDGGRDTADGAVDGGDAADATVG